MFIGPGWLERLHEMEPLIGKPLAIDALALFVEPEAGADFTVHARHELGASPQG